MRRSRHAHRAIGIFVVALVALAALPVVVGVARRGHQDDGRGHRPPGVRLKDEPRITSALLAHRRASAPRSSAVARRRSRTAYRGRSRSAALRLLRRAFPHVATIPTSVEPKLPPGARIERYLGDYAMRIALPGTSRRQLVVSPLPLRAKAASGRRAKVSLAVRRASADFAPVNPLVDSVFPKQLGDGVGVGSNGLRVRPLGADAAAATGTATGDQVFYPDTATDSDTLVTPTPTGVELFIQLRSANAPESQSYQFELPAGAALRGTDDGGAEVVHGQDRLAVVAPPSAQDADGQSVPARYAVSGRRLTVTVDHRLGDHAYPILVDPLVEAFGNRPQWRDSWFYNPDLDQLGWFFADSPQGAFTASSNGTGVKSYGIGPGHGLYVFAPPDTKLPPLSYGEWLWRAPGETTYIPRVDFGLMYRDQKPDSAGASLLIDGIWSDSRHFFSGAHVLDGPIAGQSDTVRAGDNYPFVNERYGNTALFALALTDGRKRQSWVTAYLGGAAIYLDDPESPTITAVDRQPQGTTWIDADGSYAGVTGHDPGLGVAGVQLAYRDSRGRSRTAEFPRGCGNRFWQCDADATAYAYYSGLDLPQTTSTVTARLEDPVGHLSAPNSWQVRPDAASPTVALSGALKDADGRWLGSQDYPLQITTRDGDAAHPSSGVKAIDVLVDGDPVDHAEQPCPNGNCALSRAFTLKPADYAEGSHTLSVYAWDYAGRYTQVDLTFKIDRRAPLLGLSGPLAEHAGGWLGSDPSYSLTLNASDGNLVRHGSGVKSIEVQVDGQRKLLAEQPCDQGDCSMSRELSFNPGDYADGQHTVRAVVTDFAGHSSEQSFQVGLDRAAPGLAVSGTLKDAAGGWLTADSYALRAVANDGDATHPGSGVKSVEVLVDGQRRDFVEQPCDQGGCSLSRDFTFRPGDYGEGSHVVTVVATDTVGRTTRSEWTVKWDAAAPALDLSGTLVDHAAGWLSDASYSLTASATDGGSGVRSVEILVNGQRAAYTDQPCDTGACSLTRDLAFATDLYGDGRHEVKAIATDVSGRVTEQVIAAKVDRTAPTFSLSGSLKDAEGTTLAADQYELAVNVFDGTSTVAQSGAKSVELLVDGQRADYFDQPCPAGSCPLFHDLTFDPAQYAVGDHTLRVVVSDQTGRTAEASWHLTVPAGVSNAPRATKLKDSSTTSLYDSNRFLYAGPDPVQTGANATAISPTRIAVLRGRVETRDGQALPAARISVVDHPEFGATTSGPDGRFYMAVNGGGRLRVRYEKPGYLPSERWVDTPWQDYAFVDDVALVPLDPNATAVDLGAGPGSPLGQSQVVRGSEVTDEDGTRRATLLFRPGTQAQMVLPGGATQALSTLHVRATEYTVGDGGPEAMPGELPATSAYTYAAEYSVDEAMAASATAVQFTRPVVSYTDDFIGIPTGVAVPSGYYDRERGAWVAAPDGRVVSILSETGGRAQLDVAGHGEPATAAQLAGLGIDDEELARVAELYPVGKSLWRVPVDHFSARDHNYAPRLAADAVAPDGKRLPGNPEGNCEEQGSEIGCESQTLGETVPLTDVGASLHYQSSRTPGQHDERTVRMRVLGTKVPGSLLALHVTAYVAGREFTETVPMRPNAEWQFTWDGKDVYGRAVQGSAPMRVKITYKYSVNYATAIPWSSPDDDELSFGGGAESDDELADGTRIAYSAGGGGPTGSNRIPGLRRDSDGGGAISAGSRSVLDVSRQVDATIGGWDARREGLGGWSLDGHHAYDPIARRVYNGDGTFESGRQMAPVVSTVANADNYRDFGAAAGLDVGPDGSVFIADFYHDRILRRWPDGRVTLVAGKPPGPGESYTGGFSGDGGPATEAKLQPSDVAVTPDGSVYFTDPVASRVRRVAPDGTISTVAGTGTEGHAGDGGLARDAQLYRPNGIAVGSDGSLYIAERINADVRKIDPAGTITTVLGHGCKNSACSIELGWVGSVAVMPDDTIYVAGWESQAAFHSRLIRKRPGQPAEELSNDAKGGLTLADGVSVKQARLRLVAVEPAPDGRGLMLIDSFNRKLRLLTPDDKVTTIAGDGCASYPDRGDGKPATAACWMDITDATGAPDGSIYTSEFGYPELRRISAPLPGFDAKDFSIPSKDGSELYRFDSNGRHLRTLDADTGVTLQSFGYDAAGRLTTMTDGDGNVARVERSASGAPSAIVGPDGVRDTLDVNADGYLSRVTNPAGESFALGYGPEGLLTSFTDPKQNTSTLGYDPDGRLLTDTNAAQKTQTLSRADQDDGAGWSVTHRTPMGRPTTYSLKANDDGSTERSTTDTAGGTTRWIARANGTETLTTPDGSALSGQSGPDPRWGMLTPLASTGTFTTAGGRHLDTHSERTVVQPDRSNPFSMRSQTEDVTIAGAKWSSTFDVQARRTTDRSPAGRLETTDYDGQGRPLAESTPGFAPVSSGYDARGRLALEEQGSRRWTYDYDADGNVRSIADPLSRATTFSYDAAGRVTREHMPDGREVGYEWDRNGNLASITPPGRPAHAFSVTALDQPFAESAPDAGDGRPRETRYAYDDDGQPTSITRPGAAPVTIGYDSAGRLATVSAPEGDTTVGYDDQSGQVRSLAAPSGERTTFDSDGPLALAEHLTGPVTGETSRTFDDSFRISSTSVNGANAVGFFYDRDGLITAAGDLAVTRDAANGTIKGTTLGSTATSETLNAFGEGETFDAKVSGAGVFSETFAHDDLGRITQRTETGTGGATHSYAYTYDAADRLADVRRDGALVSHYDYDANGNRTARTTGTGATTTGSYDAQDRLTEYGGAHYGYDAAGDLRTRTQAGATTTYTHDGLGSLTAVELPDGRRVSYVLDGSGDRVGKRIDGQLVQGLLYGETGAPVAELAPDGSLRSRFVYATRDQTPDYMIRGGHTYRIVADERESPRLVIDAANGEIVEELDYDEFGNVTRDTNPGFQPFGFAGGIYDRDTKLVHFGAREYDPETGRFTTKDPIGFDGGDTNLYGYVEGDPINGVDPSGLFFDDLFKDVSNAVAGWGDSLTMGLTRKIRKKFGWDNVDYCSGAYRWGGVGGDLTPTPGKIFNLLRRLQRLRRGEEAARDAGRIRHFAQRGKQRLRHTEFDKLSDREVSRRARDKTLPAAERRKYVQEDKARKERNKQRRQGR